MTKYKICEQGATNSFRKCYWIATNSLTGAKVTASKRQMFHDTILIIENKDGDTLAVKRGWRGWSTSIGKWDIEKKKVIPYEGE